MCILEFRCSYRSFFLYRRITNQLLAFFFSLRELEIYIYIYFNVQWFLLISYIFWNTLVDRQGKSDEICIHTTARRTTWWQMELSLLSFNFIPSMTYRTYCNHSLANYQYVKSTAVTHRSFKGNRNSCTVSRCPSLLRQQSKWLMSSRVAFIRWRIRYSLTPCFHNLKKPISKLVSPKIPSASRNDSGWELNLESLEEPIHDGYDFSSFFPSLKSWFCFY